MFFQLVTTSLTRYFTLISRTIYKSVASTFFPLLGFGVGWSTFVLLSQDNSFIGDTKSCHQLNQSKVCLHLNSLLATVLGEKYFNASSFLQSSILSLSGNRAQESKQDCVSFIEILGQCGVREQILYLEEHATEPIPYFFIADIFHAWSKNHKDAFLNEKLISERSDELSTQKRLDILPLTGSIKAFESHRLCDALWKKVRDGVIPFDVGIRALCVLAIRNRNNARWMVRNGLLPEFLKSYDMYQQHLNDTLDAGPDEVISSYEVTAAMMALVKALYDASTHSNWFGLLSLVGHEVYPLTHSVNPDQWCRLFYPIKDAQILSYATKPALTFVSLMCKKSKCSEKMI